MASPAERDEYAEYFCGSGAIACRVLYRTEELAFVQFRTVDWPGYWDFGNYARVALFPEHLRPADPQSPGVVGFTQALAREVAVQQQHLANCRHHGAPSGNGSGKKDTRDGQVPVHKPASAKVTRSNGAEPSPVKPSASEPAKTPARQRKKPDRWRGLSFFEARSDSGGPHDRGFSLRSLISHETPFPEVLRCPTTDQAVLTTQHAAITAKKITAKACGPKSTSRSSSYFRASRSSILFHFRDNCRS